MDNLETQHAQEEMIELEMDDEIELEITEDTHQISILPKTTRRNLRTQIGVEKEDTQRKSDNEVRIVGGNTTQKVNGANGHGVEPIEEEKSDKNDAGQGQSEPNQQPKGQIRRVFQKYSEMEILYPFESLLKMNDLNQTKFLILRVLEYGLTEKSRLEEMDVQISEEKKEKFGILVVLGSETSGVFSVIKDYIIKFGWNKVAAVQKFRNVWDIKYPRIIS